MRGRRANNMIDEIVRKNIRELMVRSGIRPRPLSQKMGKGPNFISTYLNRKTETLKLNEAAQMATCLNAGLEDLLGIHAKKVDVQLFSEIAQEIENALEEKNIDLPPVNKAELIAYCYNNLYTEQYEGAKILKFPDLDDLIAKASHRNK